MGWLRLAEDEAWARAIPSGFVLIDGAALGAVAEPVWQFMWPFTATYSLDNTKFTWGFCFLTIASLQICVKVLLFEQFLACTWVGEWKFGLAANKNLKKLVPRIGKTHRKGARRWGAACRDTVTCEDLWTAELGQELWPFTPALRRAAALGVPFQQVAFGAPFGARKIWEDMRRCYWDAASWSRCVNTL